MKLVNIMFFALLPFHISCQQGASQTDPFSALPSIAGYQLIEDLNEYRKEMETNHPGLFWYQTRNEWDSLFHETEKSLGNGTSLLGFYKNLASINANIRCGHTRISLGRDGFDDWSDTLKIFPLTVRLVEGKLLVKDKLSEIELIKKGDEILDINGIASEDIVNQMLPHVGMDGFNQTGKYRYIENRFPLLYAALINPVSSTFVIRIQPGNSANEIQINVEGTSFENYEANWSSNKEKMLEFKELDNMEETYFMRIKTFSSNWMNSEGYNYFKFLKESFKQLKEENGANLILDLRGNGGGDDGNGSKLMSYLVDESFGYYKSIEVKPAYDGWGDIEQREDGKYYVTAHQDLYGHEPSENQFPGNVFILIDGGSFSATSEFAALIHDAGRATFIGEETGGGYYGNTSGNRKQIELANTGISVSIPYWKYLVDIEGDDFYGKGVIPDHQTSTTSEDFINNRDTALEFTKTLINSN